MKREPLSFSLRAYYLVIYCLFMYLFIFIYIQLSITALNTTLNHSLSGIEQNILLGIKQVYLICHFHTLIQSECSIFFPSTGAIWVNEVMVCIFGVRTANRPHRHVKRKNVPPSLKWMGKVCQPVSQPQTLHLGEKNALPTLQSGSLPRFCRFWRSLLQLLALLWKQ